ncbi:hypothetical protein M3398_30795 [Streptomyces albidoflavus]|uniref:hypothetical protein n=1 Tax=Streptomyces albidoflavus TaxID=1886 RepID=UPI0020BF3719|nr:hypothetical protein [Streptomyces albidoflavus]MCL6281654.1 hypothetical protein [Streptomyces albidoflavus]WSI90668.1 hypothetical protein OG695_01850 [Streptomyces albidoflavus]
MPQRTRPRPICGHCDGFPTVTITTGTRTPDGQRKTITAHCPACHGTGHTAPAARAHTRIGA